MDQQDQNTKKESAETIDKSQDIKETNVNKEQVLLNILKEIKSNLENAIELLGGEVGGRKIKVESNSEGEAKIIEGIFAGDKMIGADGKDYSVPPNYASKSKLVEGDIMKLTITSGGNFIYKQTSPITRRREVGELIVDCERDEHWVVRDLGKWRILKASVTYFKGNSGDQVVFLVPQDSPSKWAAVENIIKKE